MDCVIDKNLSLELLKPEHARVLFELVDANRAHLRKWMPWLDLTNSVLDTEHFIQTTIEQYENGLGPQFAVKYDGVLCGVNGFHKIDVLNKIGSIGYWLDQAHCGKGIVTKSSRALLKMGFDDFSLHKIEIRCAVENLKSRAIPERLGLKYEATLRDCEWLYTKYVSHAVYSILASEFDIQ